MQFALSSTTVDNFQLNKIRGDEGLSRQTIDEICWTPIQHNRAMTVKS